MPLTVTPAVDVGTAAVRLSVAGGVPPYVADASPGGDRPDYRVRTAWSSVVGDATARVGIDGSIPLGVPTQYVITDATGVQVTSAPVTADSATPILSDATDPGRAMPVLVVSQKPNQWQARSVWWDILGASAPFASVAPLRFRAGALALRIVGNVERSSLLALLRTGNPLVFRGTCEDAVDDVILLVETVDESLVLDDAPAGATVWALTYQAISRELGPYAVDAGRSYATVKATFPTYDAVKATYATYDALRAGDATAGLGPELVTNGTFSGGLTGWSTFWTYGSVAWDTTAGTGRATTAAGVSNQSAVLECVPLAGAVTAAGKRYRFTGRVRCSAMGAGATVYVHLLTTTAPDVPGYFQAGNAITQATIPNVTAAWSTFTVEATVPTGDDRMTVYFRTDGLPAGGVVEWDDLSIKERT